MLIVAFIAFPTWIGAPTRERVLAFIPTLRSEAIVLFGGDMMFDRTVRSRMARDGDDYVFSCIAERMRSVDVVVANLEGPVTEQSSRSLGSVIGSPENFVFTFPTSTPSLLARHNVWLVNLGNNHMLDFGWEGEAYTRAALRAARIEHFGSPGGSQEYRTTLRGVPLAFINYNEFAPEGWRANAGKAEELIQRARHDKYLPVVYTHWGDEYEPASSRVKTLARSFIDKGAEIVIGSHPHIVQEREVYKGKHIYYSLGNLVFDQYWDENVRRGLLLQVIFTQAGVERLEEIPIDNQSGPRPCAV